MVNSTPPRGGRVAVGILAAAHRNDNGAVGIALAVEQPEQDAGAVDLAVNGPVGGLLVFRVLPVFLQAKLPGLLPVLRIGAMPRHQVPNHLRVLAFAGNRLQRGFNNLLRVAFKERGGIHRAHELPRIQAIPVVHQAAELLTHLDGNLRQPRPDQTRVISLDLVVNVVGAFVEPGMPGVRGGDARAQVLAPGVVRAPERVAAVREIQARLANGGVEAVLLERAQESHLHIDVVLLEGVVDQGRLPDRDLVQGDDLILELELGRRAPRNAGHLAHPTGLHFVAVFRQGETAIFNGCFRSRSEAAGKALGTAECEQDRNESFHGVNVQKISGAVNAKAHGFSS